MQKRWLIIGGCVVFGVSLIAHLPAKLVLPKSAGKFQLNGISGSVWRGEVEQLTFYGQPLPIGTLNWSVSPAALLLGKVNADFHEQQNPGNRGSVDWNLFSRQLEVHELQWRLPAESISPWTAWAGVTAQGQFVLDLQTLVFPPGETFPSQLEGQAAWRDAVLRVESEYWPIGSPVAQLAGGGDAISGVVNNSQPTLPGDGSFQCTLKICQVTLRVKPTLDAPQSVLNGLQVMGFQRNGNEFSGQVSFPLE
jgi:hypothetical protein